MGATYFIVGNHQRLQEQPALCTCQRAEIIQGQQRDNFKHGLVTQQANQDRTPVYLFMLPEKSPLHHS